MKTDFKNYFWLIVIGFFALYIFLIRKFSPKMNFHLFDLLLVLLTLFYILNDALTYKGKFNSNLLIYANGHESTCSEPVEFIEDNIEYFGFKVGGYISNRRIESKGFFVVPKVLCLKVGYTWIINSELKKSVFRALPRKAKSFAKQIKDLESVFYSLTPSSLTFYNRNIDDLNNSLSAIELLVQEKNVIIDEQSDLILTKTEIDKEIIQKLMSVLHGTKQPKLRRKSEENE